jgi:hypothetical protein
LQHTQPQTSERNARACCRASSAGPGWGASMPCREATPDARKALCWLCVALGVAYSYDRGRAMKLKLVFLFLLCSLATVQAQTTLTPGVVSPTPSSPTGLPAGPTFSSCSYACNSQYLSCVNPCSTAAGIAAGTPFTDPNVGARAQTTVGNTSQCFSNCTNLRQTCTLGCSGLPFD